MTDKERLDWLERTGASIAGITSDSLVPMEFAVCVRCVTGWVSAPTVREALDKAAREFDGFKKAQ